MSDQRTRTGSLLGGNPRRIYSSRGPRPSRFGFVLLMVFALASPLETREFVNLGQTLAPNSEGNLESMSEVFFNWGVLRSGFVYRSQDLTKRARLDGQDIALSLKTRSYDLILLKLEEGILGGESLSFSPWLGACLIDRQEQRIGENLSGSHFWFTHNTGNTLYHLYLAGDFRLNLGELRLEISGGGGYLSKSSREEYRSSLDPLTILSDSTTEGFRGWAELRLAYPVLPHILEAQLVGGYEQEGAYFWRFASDGSSTRYAYYIRQIGLGIELHLKFLGGEKGVSPHLGVYYLDYEFEPLKRGVEGYRDHRLRFDLGIKF